MNIGSLVTNRRMTGMAALLAAYSLVMGWVGRGVPLVAVELPESSTELHGLLEIHQKGVDAIQRWDQAFPVIYGMFLLMTALWVAGNRDKNFGSPRLLLTLTAGVIVCVAAADWTENYWIGLVLQSPVTAAVEPLRTWSRVKWDLLGLALLLIGFLQTRATAAAMPSRQEAFRVLAATLGGLASLATGGIKLGGFDMSFRGLAFGPTWAIAALCLSVLYDATDLDRKMTELMNRFYTRKEDLPDNEGRAT